MCKDSTPALDQGQGEVESPAFFFWEAAGTGGVGMLVVDQWMHIKEWKLFNGNMLQGVEFCVRNLVDKDLCSHCS